MSTVAEMNEPANALSQIASRKAARVAVARTLGVGPYCDSIRSAIARRQFQRRERRARAIGVREWVGRNVARRWQSIVDSSASIRAICRREAGEVYPFAVVVQHGTSAPYLAGRPYAKYHWHNCGASGTVYHPSTHRICVGTLWLEHHAPRPTAAELARVRGPRECRAAMDRVGPAEHAEWYTEEARLRRERDRLLPGTRGGTGSAWDEAKSRIAAVCDPAKLGWIDDSELRLRAAFAAQWLAYAPAADAYAAHLAGQPADDRRRIERPYLIAKSRGGLLIADRREDPREVQVVVRDATTGLRHCIPVPPAFGRVGSGHWRRLRTDAARMRAAVAWTFSLPAEEYRPAVEA